MDTYGLDTYGLLWLGHRLYTYGLDTAWPSMNWDSIRKSASVRNDCEIAKTMEWIKTYGTDFRDATQHTQLYPWTVFIINEKDYIKLVWHFHIINKYLRNVTALYCILGDCLWHAMGMICDLCVLTWDVCAHTCEMIYTYLCMLSTGGLQRGERSDNSRMDCIFVFMFRHHTIHTG